MTLTPLSDKSEKQREEDEKRRLGQKEYYRRKREEHAQKARRLNETFGSEGKE